MNQDTSWQQCNSQLFWRDIAPNEHVVQIYEDDQSLLDLLESYVAGGLTGDESVILIATRTHIAALELRLRLLGLNLTAFIAADKYIPLDAETLLATFMVNDWPDYNLFVQTMNTVFDRVKKLDRPIRAFGEMVGLLMASGNSSATVMLEHYWNTYCESRSFALFCAYHQEQFAGNPSTARMHVCHAHAKVIKAGNRSGTELVYQNM